MAREIELKFIALPATLARVRRLSWLKKLVRGRANAKTLRSVYFDTAAQSLEKNEITLRIRHDELARIQTIKTAGGVERGEWETPVAGNQPDLKEVRRVLSALGRKKHDMHALRPVFETRISRTAIMLHFRGSEIELALDRGTIVAKGRRESVCEIELELKRGRISNLLAVGERLARALPVAYNLQAKAERGYALIRGAKDEPVKASAVRISSHMTRAEALRVLGFSCLSQLDGNRNGVMKQRGEALHQMRIALRRLRVVLFLFEKDFPARRLKGELKWLIDQLTPARDFDVFLEEDLLPCCKAAPREQGLRQLKQVALRHRKTEFLGVKEAVQSARYRKLVLATAFWLLRAGETRGSLKRLARDKLEHLGRNISKDVAQLNYLSARKRHKLRIGVKNLRYATELLESLYRNKKSCKRRFKKALITLQDSLGMLNDVVVHRTLVTQLLHDKDWQAPGEMFALGEVHQQEEDRAKTRVKCALRAGEVYRSTRPFWR